MAEGAVQHRLREEISLFFLAKGDGLSWFLNLWASVQIRVQHLVFVSDFRFSNFKIAVCFSLDRYNLYGSSTKGLRSLLIITALVNQQPIRCIRQRGVDRHHDTQDKYGQNGKDVQLFGP